MRVTTIYNKNSDFVAYSVPGHKEHTLSVISQTVIQGPSLSLLDFDFVFAPYDNTKHDTYLFSFDEQIKGGKFQIEISEKLDCRPINKHEYIETSDALIDRLKDGECQKVVLSREKKYESSDIDAYEIFIDLKNKYPDAFVYCLSHRDIGVWIGATPEVLLSQDKGCFQTTALAGTQKYTPNNRPEWTTKEIKEHDYIEQFIIGQLDFLGIDYNRSDIKDKQAGSVVHRQSIFNFHTDISHLQKVINALHPGPAISGYPKEKAMQMISEIEHYDRKYYCGYLGPVSSSSCELYINLRCMSVHSDACNLYLGGGITKGSKSVSEWIETELKSKTLLDVLESTIIA